MIQQPRVPSSGLMPASDVLIRAKEVSDYTVLGLKTLTTALFQIFFLCLFFVTYFKITILIPTILQVITNRDTLIELLAKHTGNVSIATDLKCNK